jgi:glycosyltransferase involved in cell wall biosynthesis
MKVGINLRLLVPGKIGGHEGYVRNIIKYFSETGDISLFLFVTDTNNNTFASIPNKVTKIVLPSEGYGRIISKEINDNNIDLYFCPLMVLEPVIVHIPTVINIPDVQHEYFPEFFDKDSLNWRQLHYNASVANANMVLTVSEFSRRTFLFKYNISPDKVKSVYLAGDEIFHYSANPTIQNSVRQRYSLPETYGYFPANTWPHKNHHILLKAMQFYKSKYGSPPKIVLTGAKDTGHKDLLRSINEYDLNNDIVFLGYLPKEDMPYIYRNASFLVFPSLFEGFGMPVLEAMLCECPVICSNTTSLPEVAGDAALFFDPNNPEELAERMNQILADHGLRNNIVARGLVQARKFTWQHTAEQTLSIFRSLASRPKPPLDAQPLVSVVTPSYSQGEFIEETILSVVGQDYANIEYIVMDGGSKDQTVEILKKYDDRIQWVSEADKGQADAVNKGFRLAKGNIIGWLNSDDTYLPGAIKKVMDYFDKNPDTVMVYGNAYYTDKDGIITDRYPSEPFNVSRLAENCYICQPSVFIRADALKEIGELDVNLRTCMDFDLWIRFSKLFAGRIAFIEDYLATSRMYLENKTLSLREKVYDEITQTVKRHFGYVAPSWMYGYIDDVIAAIFLKRLKSYQLPFKTFYYWYYVLRFALHLKSLEPFEAARYLSRKETRLHSNRYPDGWVSDDCVIALPKSNRQNTIRINGRNLSPFDDPLVINISANSIFVKEVSVPEKGEFAFDLDLPEALLFESVLDVHFKPNRSFVPKDLGINDDTRVLSFIIDSISLVAAGKTR